MPISFDPPSRTTNLVTGFLQDDIALRPDRWILTLGAKLEHNDFSGLELQPNVRLLWSPVESHTLWAAVSRAVRSPSRVDSDVHELAQVIPGAGALPLLVEGNRSFRSEELISYELGYRSEPSRRCSRWTSPCTTTTTITSDRWSLQPIDPAVPAPRYVVTNGAEGETYGGTSPAPGGSPRTGGCGRATRTSTCSPGPGRGTRETIPTCARDSIRRIRRALQSSLDLRRDMDFDVGLRYVDSLPLGTHPGVRRGRRADRLDVRPDMTLSLVGQDLLHDRHAEFPPSFFSLEPREIERRGYAKVLWRF